MINGLRFLHILAGAAWLGAAIWVAGDVRRTLALGKPHLAALPARIGPALGLDLWAGIATVLLGTAYMFVAYDGGHPPARIMGGFGLAIARVLLTALLLKPAWSKLAGRITAGEDVAAGDPAAKKLGMFSGIGHLLWILILGSMVFG